MWKHCPKQMNRLVGYRTKRSMTNLDTWRFAHAYCGRLWWKLGLAAFLPTILVQIPFMHSSDEAIGILGVVIVSLQGALLFLSIILTERALKRNFTLDGARVL